MLPGVSHLVESTTRWIRLSCFFICMREEADNVRKLVNLLGDTGFVDAISNAEELVRDAEATLERVEKIEGDAEQAVREANVALNQVDSRLQKFDETMRLIEAKIEAAFSIGFFFFALTRYLEGDLYIAAALAVMGLMGAGSLIVTIATMPQVQKLLSIGEYASDQVTDLSTGELGRRDGRRKRMEAEAREVEAAEGRQGSWDTRER